MCLGAVLAACGSEPAQLTGFVREPTPVVATVALPDVSDDGAPMTMTAPDSGLLLMYFGYTGCPDVCPTTMADVRRALSDLGDDASRVEVAMATIDPDRDTDDILTGYVQTFVPNAHALRTDDDDALRTAADAFGADYGVTVDGDDIEVLHTGHVYVVNDQGELLVTWPFGTTSEDMTTDMQLLLRDA